MNHFGVGVEYALHVLTQLARFKPERPPSAKALADFQGVPAAYLASPDSWSSCLSTWRACRWLSVESRAWATQAP